MTAPPVTTAEPLLPEQVRALHLAWSSPFDSRSLADHLRAFPGRSYWLPDTSEYVIGEPWRHRSEITAVVDIYTRDHGRTLLSALRQSSSDMPHELVLMSDFVGARPRSFYGGLGLGLMQEVICYELRAIPNDPPRGMLRFQRAYSARAEDLEGLLAVDHVSFPWLWWNNPLEFATYERVPGVELYLGRDAGGTPVAYVGVTHFRGWGHLDRIGVVPGLQGRGLGLEALRFAVQTLAAGGATRLGLSTQANNTRSQRLYHRYGFQRTYQNDYDIYGAWVDPNRAAAILGEPATTERDG